MTLLRRREEDLGRTGPNQRADDESHAAVTRPRPTARGLHYVQAAIGNRAAARLGADAVLRKSRAGQGAGSAGASLPRRAALVSLELKPLLDSLARSEVTAAPRGADARDALPGLIVGDRERPGPGQIRRGGFVRAMHRAAIRAAEEGLAQSEHTARGCPWIEHYFDYYRDLPAERLERDLLRWVPAARSATSAEGYVAAATDHIAGSVRVWAASGRLTGLPRGLPGMGLVEALRRAAPAGSEETLAEGLGEGRPLDATTRSRMEGAFGEPLDEIRVHTDARAWRAADRLHARAFAVGRHVGFARGEYRPGTPAGDALVAHELAHVLQQRSRPGTASAPERALEADADRAAAGVVSRLWSRRAGLSPRAGRVRPRLGSGLALRRCSDPSSDKWFEPYRAKFNRMWSEQPYASQSATFDPTLSSKGPRNPRARAIFERLYLEDVDLRLAYDRNTSGLRERIDNYQGPEGLNLIGSPGLRALEAVFSRFEAPVSGDAYSRLRDAVSTAAANLTDADREAINLSNEWQMTINDHVRGAEQRREIRRLINPPIAPSAQPPPATQTQPLTPAQQLAKFITDWTPEIQFKRGTSQPYWYQGSLVRYDGGAQNFEVGSRSSVDNPGQVLLVRLRIKRGSSVLLEPEPQSFPANQSRMTPIAAPISAPANVPATGDVLSFEIELLSSDLATVHRRVDHQITVLPEQPLSQAAVEAIAQADNHYLNDQSNTGLLGIMRAAGGLQANVAEMIVAGEITLMALTQRHDSAQYVQNTLQRVDPGQVGYFAGPDYSRSFVAAVGAAAFRLPRFGPRFVVVNRTSDLNRPSVKESDQSIILLLIHEAVHAVDVRPNANLPLERYKTEFRAYWMDGRYGPPDQLTCPNPGPGCLNATYDSSLPPPGPKSPRARAIFENLYGSATYDFVKSNYDDNTDGFREAVDHYLVPDGINLIVSIRLEALRRLIADWSGSNFEGFRGQVRGYMGDGPVPQRGALTDAEKREIRGNRAWRDLIEREIDDRGWQLMIKEDLNIPR